MGLPPEWLQPWLSVFLSTVTILSTLVGVIVGLLKLSELLKVKKADVRVRLLELKSSLPPPSGGGVTEEDLRGVERFIQ